ncbi:mannose-1-phosphate guanylyltransferase [Patescibacteria group bacterium]
MESDYKKHLYVIILAGGGGTRLWPRSRNKTPKQFLKLFKGKTLTQITVDRFRKMIPWERLFIVTVSEEYKKEILKEVPKFLPENIFVEPARRDTAPAHGIGAAYIHKLDPDAVIITEAADRLVKPLSKYVATMQIAAKVAYEKKVMVAVGVKPRYPHTGYGHIKKGKSLGIGGSIKVYKVDKFVEKPPLPIAKKYTKSGNYYWNAGQFVWRADTLLKSIKTHAPKIGVNLTKIEDVIGTSKEKSVIAKSYKAMPKIAIDYAIVEKDSNFVVAEATFFWTDIGDWSEVWKNLPHDKNRNVIIDGDEPGGRVINIDSTDTLIHMDGRLIATIDVDDIVIVDMKDALVVCKKSRSQSVKKIVNQLKEEGKEEFL